MLKKVIKFSATWCAPCKALAPKFHNVSELEEFKDIEFKEVDIEEDDEADELVEKYKIRNVPTIVLADEWGAALKTLIGNVQESDIVSIIKSEMK